MPGSTRSNRPKYQLNSKNIRFRAKKILKKNNYKKKMTSIYKVLKGLSPLSVLFRFLIIGLYGFVLSTLLFLFSLKFFVSGENIVDTLKSIAESKLLAELQVNNVVFDPFYSLKFDGISLGVPGKKPFFSANSFRLEYDLTRLLLLQIKVNKVHLEHPEIYLNSTDSGSNIAEILAYLEKSEQSISNSSEPTKNSADSEKSTGNVPFNPEYVYLPAYLSLENILIENLSFKAEWPDGVESSGVLISCLNAFGSIKWRGNQSRFQFEISDYDELEITLKRNDESYFRYQGRILSDVVIENFARLSWVLESVFDLENSVISLAESEQLSARVETKFFDKQNKVEFSSLVLDLGEDVSYHGDGYVSWNSISRERLNINVSNKLKANLAKLCKVMRGFGADTYCSGDINVHELKIDGDFDLNGNADFWSSRLPLASMKVTVNQVSFRSDKNGVNIGLINGVFGSTVSPDILSEGQHIDFSSDLKIDKLTYYPTNEDRSFKVSAEQIRLDSILRLALPEVSFPFVRLDIESEGLGVGVADRSIHHPILIALDAEIKRGQAQQNLDLEIEYGDLFEVKSSLLTHKAENSASAKVLFKIGINPVVEFLRTKENADSLPIVTRGGLTNELSIDGKYSDLVNKKFFSKDWNIENTASVSDLDLELPSKGVWLKGLSIEKIIKGNILAQKLIINQSLGELRYKEKSKEISVGRQRLTLEAESKGNIKLGWPKLREGLETSVQLNTWIQDVRVNEGEGLQNIGDLILASRISHNQLKVFSLSSIALKAPKLGVAVEGHADFQLDDDFRLSGYSGFLKGEAQSEHKKTIAKGLHLKGSAKFESNFSSKNTEKLDIDGLLAFDNFSLDYSLFDGAVKKSEFILERASGTVPFKQKISLNEKVEANGQKVPDKANEIANPVIKFFDDLSVEEYSAGGMLLSNYEQVKSFYDKSPLTVSSLKAGGLELQNFEFDVELKQNLLTLNEAVFEVLGGRVQGDVQFEFSPAPKALKLTIHMTGLDSRKLIENIPQVKHKIDQFSLTGSPFIDGTLHIDYDLISNDIDGQIDISSIGHEQLNMILYFIDPDEVNPTIENIRTALKIGDLRRVKVPIRNGRMGMEVDIRLLSVPIRVPKLSQFPLAKLVENLNQ